MAGLLEKFDYFRRDDPVARLIVHYYFPTDFIYRDFVRVERSLQRQKRRTPWRASQETCYMRLWLATLYAVVEGYRSLNLHDPEIDAHLSSSHMDSLRRFRNATFHYQRSADKHVQFVLGPDNRIEWARALHRAFDRYFRDYRIKVIVENAMRARPSP